MRSLYIFAALACVLSAPVHGQDGGPFADFDAGRFEEAASGAEEALAADSKNPVLWALLAEARAKLSAHSAAAKAFALAAQYEVKADARSYYLRAQALQLVYAGQHAEARRVIRTALAETALTSVDTLDWAMVAIAAKDDAAAQDLLSDETLNQGFTRQTALDAGYSAKREGLDKRAVRFFEKGLFLDETETDRLSDEDRESIRREIRELTRDWSIIGQISYSTAGRPATLGVLPDEDQRSLQVGAEVSGRIGGWRNGRPFSVFGRIYHSEFLGDDAFANDATQGWLGLRYKPFSSLNLNVEGSRLIGLDKEGIDDWSVRAAISGGEGIEPEFGRNNWSYAQFYGDISYLFDNDVTYGIAEGRYGRAFAIDNRSTTLTPYAFVRAGLDTGRVEEGSLGAGGGIALRHWFDETEISAWRGFIEFDIQARERIAGDESAGGVIASITIGR
ncbi:bacteriophage N4 adsorption protein A [Qipengyuania flava]|nr:bacteriophage N4 adsorption protein A [Qipengyuania flava]